MISAGDFRNGVTVEIDGNVCQIVEFQHVKPGKGAAFVRTDVYKRQLPLRPWHRICSVLHFQDCPNLI